MDAAGAGDLQPDAGVSRHGRGRLRRFAGKTCQIWGEPVSKEVVTVEAGTHPGHREPGTILVEDGEVCVACGDATVLRLLPSNMEGRAGDDGAEFVNGARLADEERFGHS